MPTEATHVAKGDATAPPTTVCVLVFCTLGTTVLIDTLVVSF